jgi:cell division protein FtsI (penicillin-binding protein 3)
MAYGALANGGTLLQPALVREVRSGAGSDWHFRRRPIRQVIDAATAKRVSGVLQSVVGEGTGSEASLATLEVAGKTGTARIASGGGYSDLRYAASFVGYTPVEDPQLVIMAKLDDPKGHVYGGLTAAPVTRTVVQAILATRGRGLIEAGAPGRRPGRIDWGTGDSPPSPYRFASTDLAPEPRTGGRQLRLPDLGGLETRVAVARLHSLGLRAELQTSGRVTRQEPAAGTSVVRGATILLR